MTDKKFWLGILASAILSAAGAIGAIFAFAGESWVAEVAKRTQAGAESDLRDVEDDVNQLQADVASINSTLNQSLEVQRAILASILDD